MLTADGLILHRNHLTRMARTKAADNSTSASPMPLPFVSRSDEGGGAISPSAVMRPSALGGLSPRAPLSTAVDEEMGGATSWGGYHRVARRPPGRTGVALLERHRH